MIMGSEERLCSQPWVVVDVLYTAQAIGYTIVRCWCRAPISSRISKLRVVAWWRMLAVSIISTIKVDCPSMDLILGADAGEYAVHPPPAELIRLGQNCQFAPAERSMATWRISVDLPDIFGRGNDCATPLPFFEDHIIGNKPFPA